MFEVIDDFGRPLQKKLGENLLAAGRDAQQISNALFDMFIATKSSFILDLIRNNEIEYLIRKLPEKAVRQSFELDSEFVERYFSGFLRSDVERDTVFTGTMMLYSTMMHEEWYLPGQYEKTLKLLIDAFVDRIIQK